VTKATKSIISWAPKGSPDRFFTADEARQAALEIDEEYPPEIVATTDLPTAIYDWEVGICHLGPEEIWRRLDEMQGVTAPRKNWRRSEMAKTHLIREPEDCADAETDLRDGGGLVLQVTPRKGEDGFARSWL
jgi:hypothetical protein